MYYWTQKRNQYALRAIYELAKHVGQGPIKISKIATAQAIPSRFLEVILAQLKRSGLVKSKRGFYGGYYLVRSPKEISVGDIFRFMQSHVKPSECMSCVSVSKCPLVGNCTFASMWHKVNDAIFNIYDTTTIQNLLDNQFKKMPKTP